MEESQERRHLHRFPRGETCPECPARRWYSESGFRYCQNGHQVEGYIQYETETRGAESDVQRSSAGVPSKGRPEGRTKRKRRTLQGQAATDVYLECLQLVLRKQLAWLVAEKGIKAEIETVVRDLWDLRIRGCAGGEEDEEVRERMAGASSTEPESSSEGTGRVMYSSQEGTRSEDEGRREDAQSVVSSVFSKNSKMRSWDGEGQKTWPAPKVADTLAMCYLGCLLLRVGVRVEEVVSWVREEGMPLAKVWGELPKELRERLPAYYHRGFKVQRSKDLSCAQLHYAVTAMSQSYFFNYELVFPPINHTLILLQWVYELALPIDVFSTARRAIALLDLQFDWPTNQARVMAGDNPEVALMAILVVAVKMCFPFEDALRSENRLPELNWRTYNLAMAAERTSRMDNHTVKGRDYRQATTEDIMAMTNEEVNDYLKEVADAIDNKDDDILTPFFPFEEDRPREEPRGDRAAIFRQRFDVVQKRAISFEDIGDESEDARDSARVVRQAYRLTDDLPATARPFFELAADLAGISLQAMVTAVYSTERKVLAWQNGRRKDEVNSGEEEPEVQVGDVHSAKRGRQHDWSDLRGMARDEIEVDTD